MKEQKQNTRGRKGNNKYMHQTRGNKPNKRDDVLKCSDGDRVVGDINDPNYYFTDENLKNQIASFSFNQFTGVPIKLATRTDGNDLTRSFSTVMSILVNPSAGYTTGAGVQNSINLAGLSLYTKLSANNAKTSVYAPQDLTTLILGVGQLIALAGHCARAFGLTRLFNFRNRAYPKTIIEATGINYDDLVENFADYRNRYNLLMVTASQIPIPANIPYFAKCREMFAHAYLDMEGSAMAQTYVLVPDTTWLMDEQAEGGTALDVLIIHPESGTKTMSALLGALQAQIQALLNSTTLNAVYSDILRVAEKEGMPLYTFTTLPDDYTVLPVYNSEIRKWINNLTVMGKPLDTPVVGDHTAGNKVLPDPNNNGIKYRPQFPINMTAAIDPILNFDTGNATVDDIIEATRLTCAYTVTTPGQGDYTDECALPDYYVTSIHIYDGRARIATLNGLGLRFADDSKPEVLLEAMDTLVAFSNFDWGPTIYLVNKDWALYDVIKDFNYFTTVDYEYLRKLQEAAMFGLLSIR